MFRTGIVLNGLRQLQVLVAVHIMVPVSADTHKFVIGNVVAGCEPVAVWPRCWGKSAQLAEVGNGREMMCDIYFYDCRLA